MLSENAKYDLIAENQKQLAGMRQCMHCGQPQHQIMGLADYCKDCRFKAQKDFRLNQYENWKS